MPYLKRDAPAHIPPHELLESLLSIPLDDPENPDEPLDEIRPLQELTEDERQRVNLVRLAERTKRIEGDRECHYTRFADRKLHFYRIA